MCRVVIAEWVGWVWVVKGMSASAVERMHEGCCWDGKGAMHDCACAGLLWAITGESWRLLLQQAPVQPGSHNRPYS